MNEDPEIQAKIAEWKQRYDIRDDDPIMALLDVLEILRFRSPGHDSGAQAETASLDPAAIEDLKREVLPTIERLSFQTQELRDSIGELNLAGFDERIASYHEGIDYCTKKLDVVKKDADQLVVRIDKVGRQINPISRGAVAVLMLVSALAGYVLGVIL